ncbi:hypothetical protein ADP71_05990 [Vitreoscilla sp. C1]|uniref:DUF6970 domain-containing protein n=1 Tax=Vitreoscilla sp. (strain C1) TaxID=96942 RepID=UPI000CDC7B7E|nr:hypothetical protein [Vitreoscilla sp. C1]AUZ04377.1 hypothetical protein ADP71_05990 [Vitreoscilla sp. C1]
MKTENQIGIMVSLALSCVLLLTACLSIQKSETTTPSAPWLTNLITQAEAEPHLLQAVYTLEHYQEKYYLTVPGCCDRFSVLYNAQGQKICSPNGGFTGRGDGQCGNIDIRTLSKTKIWPKKSADTHQNMAK